MEHLCPCERFVQFLLTQPHKAGCVVVILCTVLFRTVFGLRLRLRSVLVKELHEKISMLAEFSPLSATNNSMRLVSDSALCAVFPAKMLKQGAGRE